MSSSGFNNDKSLATKFDDIKKKYSSQSTKDSNTSKTGKHSTQSNTNGDINQGGNNVPKKLNNLFNSIFKDPSPSDTIATRRENFFKHSNSITGHKDTNYNYDIKGKQPLELNNTSVHHNHQHTGRLHSVESGILNTLNYIAPITAPLKNEKSENMPIVASSYLAATTGAGKDNNTITNNNNNNNNWKGGVGVGSVKHSSGLLLNNNHHSTSITSNGINPRNINSTSNNNSGSLTGSNNIRDRYSRNNIVASHNSANAENDRENEDDSTTTEMLGGSNGAENVRYIPSSNNNSNTGVSSFATELANKKRQLGLLGMSNVISNSSINNREEYNSASVSPTPTPSVLSASIHSGNGGHQSFTQQLGHHASYNTNSNSHQQQNGFHNGHHSVHMNNNNNNDSLHHNGNPPITVVDKCIGFANLPNQFYRRAVKKGFEFSLMVVGEAGLGKSTLINSLFLTGIYSDDNPGPSHRIKKTVEVEASKQVLVENGVQLTLTIVDTPGFGDSVNNSECWQKILNYIENQYEQYLREESRINRKSFEDGRIHCCLYFIAPSGHGLKELDIEFMKKLHDKVNILPLIAKADTMTTEEINRFKRRILSEIKQHNINIYEFPDLDDVDENRRNKELKDKVPFAIMGSNTVFDINGRKVRGRKYPWGLVEVENTDHCDFSALREMLIRRHMQHMKDVTSNVLYENFRCYKLSGGHPEDVCEMENGSSLTQLLEERKEMEENLLRTEREMEQVFSAKVKEKEAKIKDSQAELEKRYEQMKRSLEEQARELDERRRNFEAERHAWENGYSLPPANGGTTNTDGVNRSEFVNSNGHNPSHPHMNGGGSTHNLHSTNNNVNGMMSSNSTLNSLPAGPGSGGKKNGNVPNPDNREFIEEKDRKKEKKRFF